MDRLFSIDGMIGVAVTGLTCEMVMQAGRALVLALSKKLQHRLTVCVGRDTRLSSDILENALVAGICSAGADVVKLGVLPSAAVAYITKSSNADAGVMISASHHSYEMNGLKFFSGAGYRISDDIEDEIEDAVCVHPEKIKIVSHDLVGRITAAQNAEWDYLRHLIKQGKYDFTGMRAVIDCANGCASQAAEKLYSALGVKCFMLNNKPDGMNINNRCGVMHTGLMARIIKEKRADIGLVFDGDAGKCLAITENGDIIDGDQIMSIISLHYKKEVKLKKETVVITDMSNLGFKHFAALNDIKVITSKPGEKCIYEKLLDGGYTLGGEQNGKIFLPELSTTADGLLTGIQILDALKASGKKLSELASSMEKYPQVMINVAILPQYKELWKNNPHITDLIEKRQYGLGDDGRIFVREAGAEPLIRVMVEGKSFEKINQYAIEISDKIKEQTSLTPVLSSGK
ncbi:MAG: phosphoglucosamine mutase [Oscillospiraceae bacterium]|nr:phosphoglucosamine mutase [Oscillospiraceae bacterium]